MSSAAHHKGAASGAEIEGWLSRIEDISGVVSKYLTEDPEVEASQKEERRLKVEKEEQEAFQLKMKDRYDPARYKRFENEDFIETLLKAVDKPSVPKAADDRLLSDFEKLAVKEAESCKARGNAALLSGNYEEARNQYEMGIGMDPQHTDLVVALNNNLAQVALKESNYEDCIRRTTVVLGTERLNVKALFRRASALASLYRLREAKTDVDKLISADSRNTQGLKLQAEIEDDIADLDVFEGVDEVTGQLGLLVSDLKVQVQAEERTEEISLRIAEHLMFADRAADTVAGAIGFHTNGGVQVCVRLLYSVINDESPSSQGLVVLLLRVLSKCLPTKGSSRRTLQLVVAEDPSSSSSSSSHASVLIAYLSGVVNTGRLPLAIPAAHLLGAIVLGAQKAGVVDTIHPPSVELSSMSTHIRAVLSKGTSASEWDISFADGLLVVIKALVRQAPSPITESFLQSTVVPFCKAKLLKSPFNKLADVLEMLLAVPRSGYPSVDSHIGMLLSLHKRLFGRGGSSGGEHLLREGCASITFNALVQYPIGDENGPRFTIISRLIEAGVLSDYMSYIKRLAAAPLPIIPTGSMTSLMRVLGVVAKCITVSEPLCQSVQGDVSCIWGLLATGPLQEYVTTILCHIYWRAKVRSVELDSNEGIISAVLLKELLTVCSLDAQSAAEIVSIANSSLLLGNFPLTLKIGGDGPMTVESLLTSTNGMVSMVNSLRGIRGHAEQAERSKQAVLLAQLRSAQKNIGSLIGKWASGSEALKEALRECKGFEVLLCSIKETQSVQ